MLKNVFFLIFSIILVSACSANKGTKITGKLEGADRMTAYLDKMKGGNNSEILLTAELKPGGEFEFQIPDGLKKGIYRVRVGAQLLDILSDGSEKKIEISGNVAELNNFNYNITGSPLSE